MQAKLEQDDETRSVPADTVGEVLVPRDAFGRTLEDAQREDHSWRQDYLARARSHVARLNRLEGRTGMAGVVISIILLFAACVTALCIDPVRNRGWTMEQGLQVFNGLVYGTVGACALGIAGMGVWGWLQDTVRHRNRKIGIELDAEATSPSAEFRDCSECGYSTPWQAPSCRKCGALPQARRHTGGAGSVHWLNRTYQTQTLSAFIRGAASGPVDILAFVILAIMLIVAILGWFGFG